MGEQRREREKIYRKMPVKLEYSKRNSYNERGINQPRESSA